METILEGSSLKNLGGLSKKFFTEARKVFGGNLGGFGEKPSTGASFLQEAEIESYYGGVGDQQDR